MEAKSKGQTTLRARPNSYCTGLHGSPCQGQPMPSLRVSRPGDNIAGHSEKSSMQSGDQVVGLPGAGQEPEPGQGVESGDLWPSAHPPAHPGACSLHWPWADPSGLLLGSRLSGASCRSSQEPTPRIPVPRSWMFLGERVVLYHYSSQSPQTRELAARFPILQF